MKTSYGKSIFIGALLVIGIVAAYTAFSSKNGTGSVMTVGYQIDETGGMLGVGGNGQTTFVSLDDIYSAELAEGMETGELVTGTEYKNGIIGQCRNDAYGLYDIYAYTSVGEYIVVHYKDGTLVFNDGKRALTEEFYESLLKALER